jgi:glycosyltransferase involved in cell wall biosynthesis
LLPKSETFIRRHVEALTRWQYFLAGEPMTDGLPLDDLSIVPIRLPHPSDPLSMPIVAKLIGRKRLRRLEARRPPYKRAVAAAKFIKKSDWFRRLQDLNPKLLHVHFGTNAEEAWPLAIGLKIPMVVTLHGYDASIHDTWWESGQGGKTNQHYPATLRAMAQWGAHFIAVSDAIMEDARQRGLDCGRLQKVLLGVDAQRIRPSEIPMLKRPRRILFVGRMVEKKGLNFLLRAFSEVRTVIPDAELRIIGGGRDEPQMKALADELNIPASFVGWLNPYDAIAEMGNARVLCVPSVRAANGDGEGLPTVIPEAQAAGLPVVTSARGGATEGIINGITGIAFPEGDVPALVRGLIRVLTDDDFAVFASKQASIFAAEKLDRSMHTRKLEEFYDVLTGSGKLSNAFPGIRRYQTQRLKLARKFNVNLMY